VPDRKPEERSVFRVKDHLTPAFAGGGLSWKMFTYLGTKGLRTGKERDADQRVRR
jgi:hypothetical protein